MKNDILVISSSLNPDSRSRILARAAFDKLAAKNANKDGVEWLDLQDLSLPLCDGDSAYSHPQVAVVADKIRSAKVILVAVPIYNYDVNAACKNLIELTGRAWTDKVVGFICAAGGKSSYMSVMGVANSLMLDFRCIIIPRFVYADGDAFQGDEIADLKIQERLDQLVAAVGNMLRCVAEPIA